MEQVPWAGVGPCCAALRCLSSLAFRLRGAARTPWLQDHLSPPVAAEEPAGISHVEPPAWPCLYLTVQQQVLKLTSFLFDSKNNEEVCFLVRKLYSSSNDQKGGTFLQGWHLCRGRIHTGSVWCRTNVGDPASEGSQALLAIYIPLFVQSYQTSYFIKPFVAGLSCLNPEGALRCLPPHP